jgi:enediyne biosynthesis protein E4
MAGGDKPRRRTSRASCAILALVLIPIPKSSAQQTSSAATGPSTQQQPEGTERPISGMANAGPQAAQYDSEHRPITAGGFVRSGPIIFQDVAAAAGLTKWHHTAGTREKRLILEAKGPGVCLIDYDNDGWLDIYLVNGSTYDALAGKADAAARSTVS